MPCPHFSSNAYTAANGSAVPPEGNGYDADSGSGLAVWGEFGDPGTRTFCMCDANTRTRSGEVEVES